MAATHNVTIEWSGSEESCVKFQEILCEQIEFEVVIKTKKTNLEIVVESNSLKTLQVKVDKILEILGGFDS